MEISVRPWDKTQGWKDWAELSDTLMDRPDEVIQLGEHRLHCGSKGRNQFNYWKNIFFYTADNARAARQINKTGTYIGFSIAGQPVSATAVGGDGRQGTDEPTEKSLLARTVVTLSLESRNRLFPVLAQYSRVKAVLNPYVGWEKNWGLLSWEVWEEKNGFKMRNLQGIG